MREYAVLLNQKLDFHTTLASEALRFLNNLRRVFTNLDETSIFQSNMLYMCLRFGLPKISAECFSLALCFYSFVRCTEFFVRKITFMLNFSHPKNFASYHRLHQVIKPSQSFHLSFGCHAQKTDRTQQHVFCQRKKIHVLIFSYKWNHFQADNNVLCEIIRFFMQRETGFDHLFATKWDPKVYFLSLKCK